MRTVESYAAPRTPEDLKDGLMRCSGIYKSHQDPHRAGLNSLIWMLKTLVAIHTLQEARLLDHTIRELLSLFPRGATDDQLVWRLRSSGLRVQGTELLAGLVALSERGEIVRDGHGRWRVAVVHPVPHQTARGREPRNVEVLYAVPAVCRSRPQGTEHGPNNSDSEPSLPEASALLAYYAATQREDPRGNIEEYADRHGRVWQLLQPSGRWWTDAEMRVRMELLPATLREALMRRTIRTAAIGWPITLFSGPEGIALVPGLILAINWSIDGADLVLQIRDPRPLLNPAWIRLVRRNSPWTETALIENLLPEDEESDLSTVGGRMRHALATLGGAALRPANLSGELTLGGNGLTNAAGFFLPEDGTFTKGVADDLETLRGWSADTLASTALWAVLGSHLNSTAPSDTPVISTTRLTDSQIVAADAALQGPLTVIQGPPGTGKSEVILSLILSAVIDKQSVLFAAKNHQAVDEVERRLADLIPDAPLLTRARDADGERDTGFLDALTELAHGDTQMAQELEACELERKAILKAARDYKLAWIRSREITDLHLDLSDLTERLSFFSQYVAAGESAARTRLSLRTLSELFRFRFFRPERALTGPLPERASISEVHRRAAQIRRRLAQHEQAGTSAMMATLSNPPKLADRLERFIRQFAKAITRPNQDEWQYLSRRERELKFQRIKSSRKMNAEDARAVVRHRPVWAVSTLSAPARLPLCPGLFDYVIFDEASQCDIASALPLMARARKGVIVGDPMQLRFIPPLGNAAEHALMDSVGLPPEGRASIAQSSNSLFDFCERRPGAARRFLTDQFRSSPPIVDYLNSDFYSGKLIGRRAHDSFQVPDGYKPGLTWEDVTGHALRTDNGITNQAEVERVADLLKHMARDPNFSGSVGVISPFNAQVAKLQQTIDDVLSTFERSKLSLRVATVDKFQGGEADVIVFSLVLAANAPPSGAFLRKERRRLNVAVSRARALCIIVGDLTYARSCRIRHIEFLAQRATTPWSPPRLDRHDSIWERGWSPIPQHPVGTRYLDFALDPNGAKVAVEVDGRKWHTDSSGNRKVSDRLRDAELRARGWKVLHFWVHELAADMEGCLDKIGRELRGH
jgi:hypothetical protein